jgi:predicted Zn finger-like uncharacterized protein
MTLICPECLARLAAYVDNTGVDSGIEIQCTKCEKHWDHEGNEIVE